MKKDRFLSLVLAGLAFAVLVGASPTDVWAQRPVRVEAANPQFAGEVQLPVAKSRVLRVDQPVTDVLVGNPEVADILPMTDRSVYVIGKTMGSTTIAFYGENKSLVAVVDLTVTPDLPTLRRRLHDVMPNEPIEVRAANDAVVLSGVMSNGDTLKRAVSVAEQFAPGKVTNLMAVAGSQQVMLQVRFAEIQRNVSKQIGFNTNALVGAGNDLLAISTGVLPALAPFAAIEGIVAAGNVTIDVILDLLEEKGVVRTLAEPNLIAMSGETATFLAGGEFPIPVGRDFEDNGDDTITIEFKEFGVQLAFTPTVVGDGAINLVVRPEVSAIDPDTSVILEGIQIPGLTTRRAQTTVDLRHGESFAIAGLIQSNFADSVQQFPGLGNIPILGALFRSSSFQREETELVIIVTPYLVRSTVASRLKTPLDDYRTPTEEELFLLGRVEGRAPAPGVPDAAADGVSTGPIPPGAGLAGAVGYIIR